MRIIYLDTRSQLRWVMPLSITEHMQCALTLPTRSIATLEHASLDAKLVHDVLQDGGLAHYGHHAMARRVCCHLILVENVPLVLQELPEIPNSPFNGLADRQWSTLFHDRIIELLGRTINRRMYIIYTLLQISSAYLQCKVNILGNLIEEFEEFFGVFIHHGQEMRLTRHGVFAHGDMKHLKLAFAWVFRIFSLHFYNLKNDLRYSGKWKWRRLICCVTHLLAGQPKTTYFSNCPSFEIPMSFGVGIQFGRANQHSPELEKG